jgi:peptidoglycan hydrolase-like protein with peptidoglycan-binding domain
MSQHTAPTTRNNHRATAIVAISALAIGAAGITTAILVSGHDGHHAAPAPIIPTHHVTPTPVVPVTPSNNVTPANHVTPVQPVHPHTPTVIPSAMVAALQRELGQLNYYEGPVTGVMNPQTTAAITYLQRDAQLPQTGVINSATQAALDEMLQNGNNQMGGGTNQTPSTIISGLQRHLGELNYYEGPVTGVMNPQTSEAITYLQRDAGLPQTGQMNTATQAALVEMLQNDNNQMGS